MNLGDLPRIFDVQCAPRGPDRSAQWSSCCSIAVRQVKGVAVVLMSGQSGLLHSDKADNEVQCEQQMQLML